MCRFPISPILPTSEGQTISFLQKLEMLEYKVKKLSDSVDDMSTTVTALQATVDAIPEITVTGSEGVLQSITVDDTTYNMPEIINPESGDFVIVDAGLHTGSGKYTLNGNVLTLKITGVASLTGTTRRFYNLPFLYAQAISATSTATRFEMTENASFNGMIGTVNISKNAGSGEVAFTFGTANKIQKFTQGMPSMSTVTEDDINGLLDVPMTFMI